jgi:hypothetical protein
MAAGEAPEAVDEFRRPNTSPIFTVAYLPVHKLRCALKYFTCEPSDNILIHSRNVWIASCKEIRSMLSKHILHGLSEQQGEGK